MSSFFWGGGEREGDTRWGLEACVPGFLLCLFLPLVSDPLSFLPPLLNPSSSIPLPPPSLLSSFWLTPPTLKAFNLVLNVCEVCGETTLTQLILEKMRATHGTEGNVYTFNIALKRLAKEGKATECEALIFAMLSERVEPTIVSYTTAIGACVSSSPPNPTMARVWLTRMESRRVFPNKQTYNAVLAACCDGTVEGAVIGSEVAGIYVGKAEEQLVVKGGEEKMTNYEKNMKSCVPDK